MLRELRLKEREELILAVQNFSSPVFRRTLRAVDVVCAE